MSKAQLVRQRFLDSSENGGISVEGALSAAIFFIVFIGGIELAIASYRAIGLQYVSSSVSRWATLGERLPDPLSGDDLSLKRSVELRTAQLASAFFITLGNEEFTGGESGNMTSISICPSSNIACTSDVDIQINQNFVITIREPVSILGFQFTLEATDMFRSGGVA